MERLSRATIWVTSKNGHNVVPQNHDQHHRIIRTPTVLPGILAAEANSRNIFLHSKTDQVLTATCTLSTDKESLANITVTITVRHHAHEPYRVTGDASYEVARRVSSNQHCSLSSASPV